MRSRRRTSVRKAGAIAALMGLAALTAAGALGGRQDDGRAADNPNDETTSSIELSPSTTLDRDALSDEGRALLDLVETGRAGTYHVAFQVNSPELASAGSSATLEIWRREGEIRQETLLTEPTGTNRMVALGGRGGTVSCEQPPGAEMTCQQVSGDPLDAGDDIFATILARLPTADVTVSDATIGALPARCFALTEGGTTAELCLTADGVPVRVDDGTLRLEAVTVDAAVSDETFLAPAPITAGSQPAG